MAEQRLDRGTFAERGVAALAANLAFIVLLVGGALRARAMTPRSRRMNDWPHSPGAAWCSSPPSKAPSTRSCSSRPRPWSSGPRRERSSPRVPSGARRCVRPRADCCLAPHVRRARSSHACPAIVALRPCDYMRWGLLSRSNRRFRKTRARIGSRCAPRTISRRAVSARKPACTLPPLASCSPIRPVRGTCSRSAKTDNPRSNATTAAESRAAS